MFKEIIISIQAFAKAHALVKKHRLWKWIFIPGIIYMILFIVSMIFLWNTHSSVIAWFNTTTGIQSWLEKQNSKLLNFALAFGEFIVGVILLMIYFSFYKFLWLIVGSPIFSILSEKTESILEGREFPFSMAQMLKDIARGVKLALRNLFWQYIYSLTILIIAFIPLVGWAAPILGLLVESYFFGFSMLDYSCERHKLSPSQSINFINRHKGLAVGNGMVFYVLHLIPVLGWLVAPAYSVIAATISLYNAPDISNDQPQASINILQQQSSK